MYKLAWWRTSVIPVLGRWRQVDQQVPGQPRIWEKSKPQVQIIASVSQIRVLSIPAHFRGVPPSHLASNCPECFSPKQNMLPFPCLYISPLWCSVATRISVAWLFGLPSYRAALPSGLENGLCPGKIASSERSRPRVFMLLAGKESKLMWKWPMSTTGLREGLWGKRQLNFVVSNWLYFVLVGFKFSPGR